MTRPAETWRTIPTTNGLYQASDKGRIRSLHTAAGRILRPSLTPAGGRAFTAFVDSKHYSMTVARAVALAFLGDPPDRDAQARHISIDLTDDRPSNLRWGRHNDS